MHNKIYDMASWLYRVKEVVEKEVCRIIPRHEKGNVYHDTLIRVHVVRVDFDRGTRLNCWIEKFHIKIEKLSMALGLIIQSYQRLLIGVCRL